MADTTPTPQTEEKPSGEFTPGAAAQAAKGDGRAVWGRGAWMLLLLVLFYLSWLLLIATAVLQFGWMLFTKKPNPHITDFGTKLGNWMAMNARFQSVASDDKPFPWSEWK